MQFRDDATTRLTEDVMAALVRAQVLLPDEPDHPTHYNRAFSAVHSAVTLATSRVLAAQMLEQAQAARPRVEVDRRAQRNLSYLRRKEANA